MSKKLHILYEEYQKVKKGYSDGGKITADGSDDSGAPNEQQEGFFDSVKKAFGATPAATPPVDSREEQYRKQRQQNTEDFAAGSHSYSNRNGYADGGEVTDSSTLDKLYQTYRDITATPGSRQGQMNEADTDQQIAQNPGVGMAMGMSGGIAKVPYQMEQIAANIAKSPSIRPDWMSGQKTMKGASQVEQLTPEAKVPSKIDDALDKYNEQFKSKGFSSGGKVKGYAEGTEEPIEPEEDGQEELEETPQQPNKMDLGDIPIKAGPTDELPEYTAESADAKKAIDQKENLQDELPEDDSKSAYSRLLASINPNKMPKDDDSNDSDDEAPKSSTGLQDAQNSRNNNIMLQGILKGGALIGNGLSRSNPDQALKAIGENDKYVNLPVEEYNEQIKNQQNDPNSPMSNTVKQYLTSKGIQVPEGSSAADLYKIAPFLQKDSVLNAGIQKTIAGLVVKQSEGDKNRTLKGDIESRKAKAYADRTSAMQTGKEQSLGDKQDHEVDTGFEKLEKRLTAETGSSRSAFGKSANVIRSSEAIQALLDQNPNGDLDNRQIKELARSLDSMLSNGASTVTGASGLVPSTASGDAAKIEEYLTGMPKGAGQQAFVKRLADTVKREKQIAQKQVNATQNKVLSAYSHLKQKAPDRYSDMMKAYGIEPMIQDGPSPASNSAPAVDADLSKMSPDQLKAYIATHGGK